MSGTTAIVVGASRGLGHGIAAAVAAAGAAVVAVSRTPTTFPVSNGGTGTIHLEAADAGDPTVPARLLDRHAPARGRRLRHPSRPTHRRLHPGAGPHRAGLTPDIAGAAVLGLLQEAPATLSPEYMLTGAGLQPLGD